MLYAAFAYLIIFTYSAYRILNKDIFAPSVITGITLVLGTFVAILGNYKWNVTVPFVVLLIYVLGTISLLMGEITTKSRCISSNKFTFTQRYSVNEVIIPKWIVIIALLFSLFVVVWSKKKATEIAYANGYYGADWQSMPVYVKWAVSNGKAKFGFTLSLCRQVLEVITYLGVYFFIMNASVTGIKYAFRNHYYLLCFIVPFAFMLSIQGQRSNFIGVISFAFYILWSQNKKLRVKLNYKRVIMFGGIFVLLFLVYFIVVGNLTGRAATDNAMEDVYIYVGSSIVDFAEYFNSSLGKFTFTWGTRTFSGIYSTMKTLIPFLPSVKRATGSFDFGFVVFENGSRSNVYGPYAKFYSEFGYLGVICLPFLQGCIYRLLYNNARNKSATPWSIYLFAYISYGIVIAFVDEQQFQLLFSTYQIIHLVLTYFLLNYCINNYGKLPVKAIREKEFFLRKW